MKDPLISFVCEIPREFGSPKSMVVWDDNIYVLTDQGKIVKVVEHADGAVDMTEVPLLHHHR